MNNEARLWSILLEPMDQPQRDLRLFGFLQDPEEGVTYKSDFLGRL